LTLLLRPHRTASVSGPLRDPDNCRVTSAEKVIAVVPTFRPGVDLVDRLRLIAAQVHSVIVFDDGSGDGSAVVLRSIESAGFELHRGAKNEGIAAALNAATRIALERGADFVLTVDQDTVVPADYVSACLSAFAASGINPRVGVVCADRINDAPSIPESYTESGLGIVREALQSGFLISRLCLETCGLFDQQLFIDDVDTEFCLRIELFGFVTVVGPGTSIGHSLGEQALFKPFGRQAFRDGAPATYQYHPPFRRYFIARNNVDLYFRFIRKRPRWVASSVRRELAPTVKTIISGPHRARQLLATIVGVAHGLVRRRGPLSRTLRRLLTPSG
jgi:rhamnosyltransferase